MKHALKTAALPVVTFLGPATAGILTGSIVVEKIFNIAYPFVTSFDELVAAIRSQLPDLRVEIVPGEKPVNRAVPLDIARAERVLGWTPQFDMEAAFADYISDMRAQMG